MNWKAGFESMTFDNEFKTRPAAWDWILGNNGMEGPHDRPGKTDGVRSRHNKLAELRRKGWKVSRA